MSDKIKQAIKNADANGTHVADAVYIGRDDDGYWVTDNGEEVRGLTAEQAERIATENLNE